MHAHALAPYVLIILNPTLNMPNSSPLFLAETITNWYGPDAHGDAANHPQSVFLVLPFSRKTRASPREEEGGGSALPTPVPPAPDDLLATATATRPTAFACGRNPPPAIGSGRRSAPQTSRPSGPSGHSTRRTGPGYRWGTRSQRRAARGRRRRRSGRRRGAGGGRRGDLAWTKTKEAEERRRQNNLISLNV